MTPAAAREVTTWRYPAPYDCYDMTGERPERLSDPASGFFALRDAERALVGYRCFGPDGRVPGWDYDESALDTGGGLRPDLIGIGLGREAISAGLAFGRAAYHPDAFRMTVASFNGRALRVVHSLGFEELDRFTATSDGREFRILVRVE
jgi:[ribosomal protein S18]-alanine N-acetyltransferase